MEKQWSEKDGLCGKTKTFLKLFGGIIYNIYIYGRKFHELGLYWKPGWLIPTKGNMKAWTLVTDPE